MRPAFLFIFATGAIAAPGDAAARTAGPAAPESVQRCDIEGFMELPGTDICFKAGGYAGFYAGSATDNVTGLGSRPSYGWDNVASRTVHSDGDSFVMHAQARLGMDARSSTEHGALRVFIEMQAEDANASSGGTFNLRHAFIQFGNWTFGKTTRLVAHPPATPSATEFFGFLADPYRRLVQLRYTIALGESATLDIALEDPAYGQAGEYAANWTSAYGAAAGLPLAVPATGSPERDEVPALVAAMSFSGERGSAKIAGGIRQNVYALPGGTADRAIGWRLDAGANHELGERLELLAMAYYASGFNGHSSLALGDVIWAASMPGGAIAGNVEEWMVMLGATFDVTPDVSATLAAALAGAMPETTEASVFAGLAPAQVGVEVFQLLASVFWEPVPGLEFGVDLGYTNVRYGGGGPAGPVRGDAASAAFQAIRRF